MSTSATYSATPKNQVQMPASEIVEAYIREAYAALGGGNVRVAALRPRVPASDAIFRRVLIDMSRREGIHLRGEADQKTLTGEDRDQAIFLGETARHTLLIEQGC